MKSWNPQEFKKREQALRQRMKMISSIRQFFDQQGFDEVETDILQTSPGLEPHLHAFSTLLISPEGQLQGKKYLHTSPEFSMKKLLVAGLPKIYQITKVFRNKEGSRLHRPEFTMIEWYRANQRYESIMEDCTNLLRTLCNETYSYRNLKSDPHQKWQKISVSEAFHHYTGIDLISVLNDTALFKTKAKELFIHTAEDDQWDDVFFKIFLEKIEPNLGHPTPTILYEYPVSMAALSRSKESDPRFAERFEVYVCGIELANAFGELTDPLEQRSRFKFDMALKQKLYGEHYPIDEDFINALEYGMPESSGIALGIDRLAMLLTGTEDIQDVMWLP